MLITWAVVGSLMKSLELTIILNVLQTGVHYLFERVWWKTHHEPKHTLEDSQWME